MVSLSGLPERLSNDHPIGYFLGDHFKVTLSERYFKIFKGVLATVQWEDLSHAFEDKSQEIPLSVPREKIDIEHPLTVETIPTFNSSSIPGSDDYTRDYKAYEELVIEYSRFLSWGKLVEAYKEEKQEYLEFVFDSAMREAWNIDAGILILRVIKEAIKELKKYFLSSLSNSRASGLAIIVTDVYNDGGHYHTKVCTENICVNDYRASGSSLEIKNSSEPDGDLGDILERSDEKDQNFDRDLFNFVEYYFLKSGDYDKLNPGNFPNFYEERK